MKYIDRMETRFKKWLSRKLMNGMREIAEDMKSDTSLFPELLFLAVIYCALHSEEVSTKELNQ